MGKLITVASPAAGVGVIVTSDGLEGSLRTATKCAIREPTRERGYLLRNVRF